MILLESGTRQWHQVSYFAWVCAIKCAYYGAGGAHFSLAIYGSSVAPSSISSRFARVNAKKMFPLNLRVIREAPGVFTRVLRVIRVEVYALSSQITCPQQGLCMAVDP